MFHKGMVTNTIADTDKTNNVSYTQFCSINRSKTDSAYCPHNGFFQVTNAAQNDITENKLRPVNVNNRNEDAFNSVKFCVSRW